MPNDAFTEQWPHDNERAGGLASAAYSELIRGGYTAGERKPCKRCGETMQALVSPSGIETLFRLTGEPHITCDAESIAQLPPVPTFEEQQAEVDRLLAIYKS